MNTYTKDFYTDISISDYSSKGDLAKQYAKRDTEKAIDNIKEYLKKNGIKMIPKTTGFKTDSIRSSKRTVTFKVTLEINSEKFFDKISKL